MSASPGTPKSVLRERYKALAEEHKELAENTTLERQLDVSFKIVIIKKKISNEIKKNII